MRGRGREQERRRKRKNRGEVREEERRRRKRGGGRGGEEEWRRKSGRVEKEEMQRGGAREGEAARDRAGAGTHLTSLREALRDDGLEASHFFLCHLHLLDAHRAVLHEQIGRSSRDGVAVRLLARLEEGVVLGVVFCKGVGKGKGEEDTR
jgi:hypothetical protein